MSTLFTAPITPDSVRGKIFVFKDLAGDCIDTYGNHESKLFKRHGAPNTNYAGERFSLFHVGTDKGKNRHHFAIVNLNEGNIIDFPGRNKKGIKDAMLYKGFTKKWSEDDQAFFFESHPQGSHSYYIKTWCNEEALDGKNTEKRQLSHFSWFSSGGPFIDVPISYIRTDTPKNEKYQAWQLHEVGTLSNLPSISKASKNMVVPIIPTWNKTTDPQPSDGVQSWQTVGSAYVPYFFVVDGDKLSDSIKNSPYYKLERQQRWKHDTSIANPGSQVIDHAVTKTSGWSKTTASSFSTSVGVEIGAKYGTGELSPYSAEMSISVSVEVGWEWENSSTISGQKSVQDTYHIAPHTVMHIWQVEEKFNLYDAKGKFVKSWQVPVEKVINTEVRLSNPNVPATKHPLSFNRAYKIISVLSGKLVDVFGAQAQDGVNIHQWDDVHESVQTFLAKNAGGEYYYFEDAIVRKALTIAGNNPTQGANLESRQYRNQSGQQFKLMDAGGGTYYIACKADESYVITIENNSTANGANVGIAKNTNSDAQKFRFTPA